jgi:hypothetical protein
VLQPTLWRRHRVKQTRLGIHAFRLHSVRPWMAFGCRDD